MLLIAVINVILMNIFINNSKLIITTKCNHTFHSKCIKNYIYKNLICPKCPICNYIFLDSESKSIVQKMNLPFLYNTETEDNINREIDHQKNNFDKYN